MVNVRCIVSICAVQYVFLSFSHLLQYVAAIKITHCKLSFVYTFFPSSIHIRRALHTFNHGPHNTYPSLGAGSTIIFTAALVWWRSCAHVSKVVKIIAMVSITRDFVPSNLDAAWAPHLQDTGWLY